MNNTKDRDTECSTFAKGMRIGSMTAYMKNRQFGYSMNEYLLGSCRSPLMPWCSGKPC